MFIELTDSDNEGRYYIKYDAIFLIYRNYNEENAEGNDTTIGFNHAPGRITCIKETPDEIIELIKQKQLEK